MMGIGTLILFIAVILVAAVAAAVLVSTSSSLQQRALLTGSQTQEAVATGAEAVSVSASDATSDHTIEDFEFVVRLGSGSEPMSMNYTLLLVDAEDNSWSMVYSGSSSDWSVSATTGRYAVEYVREGSDYEEGYMSRGDILKIKFNTSSPIAEHKKVRLKMIPRIGSSTLVEFTTPEVMTDHRVSMWP
ncbi:MAG: archaellin/type IV pilin N-terminal domain-containing protein [Candidatus Altiarchaeota archaeon]